MADAEQKELIEPESRMMLEGVIRMAGLTAGDVMVAAPRMDLLDIDADYDDQLHSVIRTAHSRFPVYEGKRDNVIGILMAKDLLKLQRSPDLNLRTLLRPAVFVPESKGLNELLRDFRSNRNHLAIVIDEFGATAGLITIEDVLEEIVGEIEDEFDDKDGESGIYTLADGSQRVAGDVAIDAVNAAFGTVLPANDFETIGALSARGRPRAAARRVGDRWRTGLFGHADPWRCGALVQGDAGPRGRPRLRRRLNGAVRAPDLHPGGAPRGRWTLRAELACAAALGAVQTLAFVWTAAWPLQLLCVAALAWRVDRQTPLRAAGLGLVYGTTWLGAGTWWLFVTCRLWRPAGLLAVLSVALLIASLSLYLAVVMATFVALRCGRRVADAALFAALWLLAELARGVFFTGFPWIASGYAHVDSPLAGFAPWVGVYGLGAVGAGLAAWIALQPQQHAAGWLRTALGSWARSRRLRLRPSPSPRRAHGSRSRCSGAGGRRRNSRSSAFRRNGDGPANACERAAICDRPRNVIRAARQLDPNTGSDAQLSEGAQAAL